MAQIATVDDSEPQWVQNDNFGDKDYFGPIKHIAIDRVDVPERSVPVAISLYKKGDSVAIQLEVLNLDTGLTSKVRNDTAGDSVNAAHYCDSRAHICPDSVTDSNRNKIVASIATDKFINRFGLNISWQDSDGTRYTGADVPTGDVNDSQYFQGKGGVEGMYCDTNEVSNYGAYLTGVQFYQKKNRVAIRGRFQKFK